MYTGGAGGYTFYVRGGEQVVRQRKNNSNYGESASRSQAQQARRVKWGNLVNFYKAISEWQPKAYENKTQGQTDYNIFMSLNANYTDIALTKDMALNGCSVVFGYTVSRGSLPSIEEVVTSPGDPFAMSIKLTGSITGSTTVGQFATDVLANNPQFKNGDNLALIIFKNIQQVNNYPYTQSIYQEVTLDTTSTDTLASKVGTGRFNVTTDGYLQISAGAANSHEAGVVLIHTRKVEGTLKVSTQTIMVTSEGFPDEYMGTSWVQECIDSYGVDVEVPLDPSFKSGTISNVTANSATVSNGDVLSGQQTVRVYGSNLYGSNFRLIANNVVYTPLEFGDGYIQYSITANADVTLWLNGRQYMSFRVEGVTTPAILTGYVAAQLGLSYGSTMPGSDRNTNEGCLNYPFMVTQQYAGFRITLRTTDNSGFTDGDFTVVNGTAASIYKDEGGKDVILRVTPTDATKVVYIIYEGFIFFVGNYQ